LACCLIILFHAKYELDYDLFHAKKDRNSGVITNNNAYSPFILANSLMDFCPEVENVTRVTKFRKNDSFLTVLLRNKHFI